MSFFYIFTTDQNKPESLYTLEEMVNVAKPNFIGVNLSEFDFNDKFAVYTKSKAFSEDMKKLEYLIKAQKEEEIKNFSGKKFHFF